jgi:epsilon-lactone hydrolase
MISRELSDRLKQARDDAVMSGFAQDRLDLPGYRRMISSVVMPMPDGLIVTDVVASGVPARWLCARDADSHRRVLYLHGGGFVAGGFSSHAAIAAWLSVATRCSVLLTDYRLAPEHAFPAALEDAVHAIRWIRRNGPDGKIAPAEEVFLVGDSAGGGLAISTLLQLRIDDDVLPDAGVSICPWVNLDPLSSRPMQSSNMMREVATAYAGNHTRTDPLLSPVMGLLEHLPQWLVQVATIDPVYEDGLALVRRAQEFGSPFSLDVWPDMPHVWHKYAPLVPESVAAIEAIARFLTRTCIGKQSS